MKKSDKSELLFQWLDFATSRQLHLAKDLSDIGELLVALKKLAHEMYDKKEASNG